MPKLMLRAPAELEAGFARIRTELGVPAAFPVPVLAEAERAEPAITDSDRVDGRHLPLVAIDPAGSTDLDQAFAAERLRDGFRVRYAIADVTLLLPLMDRLEGKLERAGRRELNRDCARAIPTIARLDILGFEELFEH